MLDEMSIKKHVEFDGSRFHGHVNIGLDSAEGDNENLATDALFFLVNGNWKLPIAYFLINGLSGRERANLVQLAL